MEKDTEMVDLKVTQEKKVKLQHNDKKNGDKSASHRPGTISRNVTQPYLKVSSIDDYVRTLDRGASKGTLTSSRSHSIMVAPKSSYLYGTMGKNVVVSRDLLAHRAKSQRKLHQQAVTKSDDSKATLGPKASGTLVRHVPFIDYAMFISCSGAL